MAAARPDAAEPAEAAPLIVPRRDRAAEQRPGLLERANPMRWFRNEDASEPKPLPRPIPPAVRAPDAAVETTPPVRVRPEFARYPHQKSAALPKGNRADADRYFSQGARSHQDRRLAAAIEYYRQAVTADPSFFEAQYNLGLAAYQMRDLPLALAANENAVRLKPDSADARFHFAMALRDANYPVDAADQLRQLLGEAPGEARAHLALANLYAKVLDEAALAQRHYQSLLELEPNHPEAPAIRQWLASRR
jgi:tetratricopeptide (TPR) repeat protein